MLITLCSLAILAAVAIGYELHRRSVIQGRLLAGVRPPGDEAPKSSALQSADGLPEGMLGRWLMCAGYEGEGIQSRFLLWMAAAVVLASFLGIGVESSGMVEVAVVWIEELPGGIAEVFAPIMRVSPWLLGALVMFVPLVWIRRRRRQRSEEVERDLPSVLSLLATLVESGLGFDAAAMRLESSMGDDRVLAQELARLRAATLSGMTRAAAFRAMASRLNVPSLTAFSSALIHAEAQGASVGETLRQQSVDLWARRREEAIQAAQTLPTKLAFPLVVCFLPGVFVWTFGPAVSEFLRLAGSAINGNL